MNDLAGANRPYVASAVALLFAVVLLLGACSRETGQNSDEPREEEREHRGETVAPTPGPETTAQGPPKITLGEEPGGQPEVVLRLEGGPKTTFSGLCSVGDEQNVLDGKVPKRFTFDPGGRELSCRIQKQDSGKGDLKVILTANDTTRSVQQTSTRDGVINISYQGA